MGFIAELFGYLLNALYTVFNNYGIAIIVFSIILRVILIPVTIKQQKLPEKDSVSGKWVLFLSKKSMIVIEIIRLTNADEYYIIKKQNKVPLR